MSGTKTYKAFIEIPAGSSVKYEVDEDTGELTVDRFLHTAFTYPFNYGYIKDTLGEDGDPVDVVILSSRPVVPGVIMKIEVIGILDMEDEAGPDAKLLAVPTEKIDPFYGAWKEIDDIPQTLLNQIKHFFENYKTLEPEKWVKVRDFKDKQAALAEIKNSQK